MALLDGMLSGLVDGEGLNALLDSAKKGMLFGLMDKAAGQAQAGAQPASGPVAPPPPVPVAQGWEPVVTRSIADRPLPGGDYGPPPGFPPMASPVPTGGAQTAPVRRPDFSPSFGDRMTAFGMALQGQNPGSLGGLGEQRNATYDFLVKRGLGGEEARALVMNPDLMKSVLPTLVGNKSMATFGVIGEDQLGGKRYGWIDPRTQSVTAVNIGGAGPSAGGMDPSLSGDALIGAISKQLGPGEAEKVRSIAEGRQPYPTGRVAATPYGRWLIDMVGQYEPGLDATMIGRRRVFNQQLGSAQPNSIGGQKTLMGTALGHLAEVADSAIAVDNTDGMGFAPVAHGWNAVKNWAGTASAANANALAEKVDRFSGEVGKLYSGSQGGGVTERDETRSRFGPMKSASELAAALEASKGLIVSKLEALQRQQDEIFGANGKGRTDFLGDHGRAAMAKIDARIAQLRGQSGAVSVSTPDEARKLPKGTPILLPDGTMGVVR